MRIAVLHLINDGRAKDLGASGLSALFCQWLGALVIKELDPQVSMLSCSAAQLSAQTWPHAASVHHSVAADNQIHALTLQLFNSATTLFKLRRPL